LRCLGFTLVAGELEADPTLRGEDDCASDD